MSLNVHFYSFYKPSVMNIKALVFPEYTCKNKQDEYVNAIDSSLVRDKGVCVLIW